MKRAALYARVSTHEQEGGLETQLRALRGHAAARGWSAEEYQDRISGAKDKREALDALLQKVRRRGIDLVAVTKLDRLARSVSHLVALGQEFEALGVELVVLDQAIDTTTPTGRLLFHVLAAIAEFERDLIRDRVRAGIARARSQGTRLGRPRKHRVDAVAARTLLKRHSLRETARRLGVHPSAVSRAVAATR